MKILKILDLVRESLVDMFKNLIVIFPKDVKITNIYTYK